MQASRLIGGNFVLSKAGLTGLSGAATTFSTGVAVIYALSGIAFSKAAVTGGATPTVDAITGNAITVKAGQGTVVLWCLDAAGNVKCAQGSTEAIGINSAFQFAAPQYPTLPDTLVPFAYSIHKGAHANAPAPLVGTFTLGVSNWNTTGVSTSVNDLIALPNRPQAS